MNIFSKKLVGFIAVVVLVTGTNSCVKQKFDEPPTGGTDPVMTGTYKTIAELKAMHNMYAANVFTPVSQNYYISGVVTGDDQSGNFYKEMVIQDSTGGISVLMDISNYYVDFPIGRRVFIKCQGLYMYSYNGLIELGASIDNSGSYPSLGRIPASLVSKFVLKGTYYHSIAPKVVTMDDLNASPLTYPQNTLIKIENVQFTTPDTSLTWADAVGLNDRSTAVEDCDHISVTVRSSGYSEFAGKKVPVKNGSITGVIQIYSGSLQLKIRNLDDVVMTAPRCGEISDACVYNNVPGYMTIDSVHLWQSSGNTTGPLNRVIKGVVISDYSSNNLDGKNLWVQDSTGSVIVRFGSTHIFPLGSLVQVNISNQALDLYFGTLEINTVTTNVSVLGTCVEVPFPVTIGQINSNLSAWDSKLVKILAPTITGTGDQFIDATTISDQFGSMKIYTKSSASFAFDSYPAGQLNYVLGIVSNYNGIPELLLRNASDVHK